MLPCVPPTPTPQPGERGWGAPTGTYPIHHWDLRCSECGRPSRPIPGSPRAPVGAVSTSRSRRLLLCSNKELEPHRPAPARSTTALPLAPPAAQRPTRVPGDPEPHFGSVQPVWGQRRLCRGFPWAGRGLLGLCTPGYAPGPLFLVDDSTVRRCYIHPSVSARVQNFLPVPTASLSEALVDPFGAKWVNVAKVQLTWDKNQPSPADHGSPARALHGTQTPLAVGTGAVVTVTPLSAMAQRLRHPQPGRRELRSHFVPSPLRTPSQRLVLGGTTGFTGLIPIPITPGAAVTPARAKTPGCNLIQTNSLYLTISIPSPHPALSAHFDRYRSAQPGAACARNKCGDSPRGRKPA